MTSICFLARVFVLIMVAIGIAWIPIVESFAELFHYIQSVTSFLAPPICAVYVLAVLWERVNEVVRTVGARQRSGTYCETASTKWYVL